MENSEKTTSEKITEGWVVMDQEEVKSRSRGFVDQPRRVRVYQRLIDVLQKHETKRPDIVFLRVRIEGKITDGGRSWCVASKLKVIDQYGGDELQYALFAAQVEIGDEMLEMISDYLEEAPLAAAQDIMNITGKQLKLPTRSGDPGYEELCAANKRLWETIENIDPDYHRAIRAAVAMPYYGIEWGTQNCVTTIVQLLSRDRSVEQATTDAQQALCSFNQILESRVKAIDNGLSRPTEPWYLVDEPLATEEDDVPVLDLGVSSDPPRHLSEMDREILHKYRQLHRISDTEIIYTFRNQGIEFPDHGQLLPWAAIEERKPRYEMQHSFFLTDADVEDIWKQVQSALALFEERRGYAENRKSFSSISSNAQQVATVAESLEIIRAAASEPLTEQEASAWFLCKRTILSLRDLDPQLREERLDLLQQIAVLITNQ